MKCDECKLDFDNKRRFFNHLALMHDKYARKIKYMGRSTNASLKSAKYVEKT